MAARECYKRLYKLNKMLRGLESKLFALMTKHVMLMLTSTDELEVNLSEERSRTIQAQIASLEEEQIPSMKERIQEYEVELAEFDSTLQGIIGGGRTSQ